MLFNIANQLPNLLAPVIARAFVMHFPEHPLYRIRLRTIRWQKQQLNSRVRLKPALNHLRFVDAEIIHDHDNALVGGCRIARVDGFEQLQKQQGSLALADARDDLASHGVERTCQIALLILARRDDFNDFAFWHPLITDLRQQMNVQLVGKHQSRLMSEIFKAKADARQFADTLCIRVTSDKFGAFPDPTQRVQPAAGGGCRNRNAALHLHLRRKRCATPACTTPSVSRRRFGEQRQQRATHRRCQRTGLARQGFSISKAKEFASAIALDYAINARARAKQDALNLGRRIASGTQQEDVERQQVAVASAAQLGEHLFLLIIRDVNYGRTWHRSVSMINRKFGNNRNIKEHLTVPISCTMV